MSTLLKDMSGTEVEKIMHYLLPYEERARWIITSNFAETPEIVNQSGTELPSTGGIGATIFYIVGTFLVISAGILLVTRRRMRAE